MKVVKITQAANNSVSNRRNINLTGFGQEKSATTEQVSSFNDKKSNEAIKNQFLANLSFEGHRDNIHISVDEKYGRTEVRSSSGGFVKYLDKGESASNYPEPWYRIYKHVISSVYHAKLEKGGIRASGDKASYVAKEAITESPYYYNGSHIKENSPIDDTRRCDGTTKSVYFSDPGERIDETIYADYVVYAPGAYYKKRSWYEKL